jgi:hypothetical protein
LSPQGNALNLLYATWRARGLLFRAEMAKKGADRIEKKEKEEMQQ